MPTRLTIRATAIILFLGLAAPFAALAQTPQTALMVVLDVSGSMKESVVGGIKYDLAQRGLLATLATLPGSTTVALQLLGEGAPDADECAATRLAVPFAAFDRSRWADALGTIRWDGATPLVATMREALSQLRATPATRREMLIIGDGEETCGEDPVGVARAESGDVRIHTISLGEEVSHQLAGIALVTGGTYTRAFDDTTFTEATAESIPDPEATPTPVTADAAMLEVIVDVSNSMWGQIDGRSKMELAREALRGAMAELPANVPAALRAYGHRVDVEDKQAACADTELLISPQSGAGPAIVRRVEALVPRGQTPIAAALEAAAADLEAHGGSGVLLLISDGVESCGGDPLAVAAALRDRGLPVVIHTVGLGVDAEAAAALADLAAAGGGAYFDAPTAEDLVSGVDTAVRSTREFIMAGEDTGRFPASVVRVRGGTDAAGAELIEPGTYSFEEHLFREQRYFVIRGTPGERIRISGLVCALEIGRGRDGGPSFQATPSMMFADTHEPDGSRRRGGGNLAVRGNMGDWVSGWEIVVDEDGLARFRIGRPQGNVHRDMIFRVER